MYFNLGTMMLVAVWPVVLVVVVALCLIYVERVIK